MQPGLRKFVAAIGAPEAHYANAGLPLAQTNGPEAAVHSSTDIDPFPQIASADFVAHYRSAYANHSHKAQ